MVIFETWNEGNKKDFKEDQEVLYLLPKTGKNSSQHRNHRNWWPCSACRKLILSREFNARQPRGDAVVSSNPIGWVQSLLLTPYDKNRRFTDWRSNGSNGNCTSKIHLFLQDRPNSEISIQLPANLKAIDYSNWTTKAIPKMNFQFNLGSRLR